MFVTIRLLSLHSQQVFFVEVAILLSHDFYSSCLQTNLCLACLTCLVMDAVHLQLFKTASKWCILQSHHETVTDISHFTHCLSAHFTKFWEFSEAENYLKSCKNVITKLWTVVIGNSFSVQFPLSWVVAIRVFVVQTGDVGLEGGMAAEVLTAQRINVSNEDTQGQAMTQFT